MINFFILIIFPFFFSFGEGLYKIKEDSLLFKQYKKKSATLKELDEYVKNLGKEKSFESIYILEKSSTEVDLLIKYKTKISEIVKTGDDIFAEDEWSDIISKFDLSNFDENNEKELKDTILASAKNLGYPEPKVTTKRISENEKNIIEVDISSGDVCIVRKIIFETENNFLKTALEGRFVESLKKPLTEQFTKLIAEESRKHLIENRFYDTKILDTKIQYNRDRTQADLYFTLSKSFHYEVIFYGNKFLNDSQILKITKLNDDYLFIEKNINKIKANILNTYKNMGFLDIKAEISKKDIDQNHKKIIVINILEGKRYRLKDIIISGKISRNPEYYIKKLLFALDEEQGFRYFSEERIKNAVEVMSEDLQQEGFLNSKVISTRFETNKDLVTYEITLDEGSPTQIRLIKFNNLTAFSSNELLDIIQLKTNQTLDLNLIRSSYQKIITFYHSKGFLDFKITNQEKGVLHYNNNTTFVDVIYDFHEGPQVIVKDIKISGNQMTQDKVILREIDFNKNDILSSQSIENSIYNLERTGLFGDINITHNPSESNVSQRVINIDLKEKNPGLFSSGLGVSLQGLQNPPITYKGYLGLQYNNLFQRAYRTSLRLEGQYQDRVDLRYPEWKAIFGFYEPFLFGSKTRFNTLITHLEEIFDRQKDDTTGRDIILIREANEISFLLERNISRQIKFIWNFWTLSNQKFFKPRESNPDEQTTNIGSIGPILEIDYRNNAFLPTSGHFSRVEIEYANPSLLSTQTDNREINFARISSAYTNYAPLTNSHKLVWANSVRGGYVTHLGKKDSNISTLGVPAIKAFFLGGQSTIRGFDIRANIPERIPSLSEICNGCSISDFYVPESSTYFLLKSEIRFPLFGDIGGVLFYDGGAVFIKNIKINDPFRDAAGFGFRYNTPFGALALDVGFKLDKKANEGTHSFHLSIGSF